MVKAEGLDLPNVPLHMGELVGDVNSNVKNALVQLQTQRGEIVMEANRIVNEANKEMKNVLSDKLMPEIVYRVMMMMMILLLLFVND